MVILSCIHVASVEAGRPYICLNRCETSCYKEFQNLGKKSVQNDGAKATSAEDIYWYCVNPCFRRCDKMSRQKTSIKCRNKWDDELGECISKEYNSWELCWKLWQKNSSKCYQQK